MITLICYAIVLFCMWLLYMQSVQKILTRKKLKKLEKIGKHEYRNIIDLLNLIVDEYIKNYETENNITL